MAKLTLDDIAASYADLITINANFAAIEAALENTLSRDGTAPNAMGAVLNMNNRRINNLADGVVDADAVNLGQVTTLLAAISTSGGSGDPGAPGGNVMSIGLFVDASGMDIPSGTDIVQTSGYSEPGIGHALYIFDEDVDATYVTAHSRASFLADDDRGFRLSDGQQLNVEMFGAVGDDSTSNLTSFTAALDWCKFVGNGSGETNVGPSLHIPRKTYYLASTLNVHHTIKIFGDGSGQASGVGSLLRFGKNCHGIVFHEYRTTDDDSGSSGHTGLGDATGSILQGLAIWGGNANSASGPYAVGDSPTGSGIRVRCGGVLIRDVFTAFFGQDGINIATTSGSTNSSQGNSNSFKVENCWSTYNGQYGIYIGGTDSNAGYTNGCSAVSNAAGGLLDYSFLGNTHTAAHTRDNCVSDPTGCNNPVSTCKYGGNYYYVVAGQHVAASTTTPGTNSAVWAQWGGHPSCKTWTTGLTWAEGSPYGTNPSNVNGRNVFVGCYAESAQPPVQATAPSLFLGGLLDEVGVVGSATWLRGSASSGISIKGPFISDGVNRDIEFGSTSGDQFEYFTNAGTDYRNKIINGDQRIFQVANSLTTQSYTLSNNTGGYGPHASYFYKLFVGGPDGNSSNGSFIGAASNLSEITTNLSGQTITAGWRWFYRNPTLGGSEGLVCTTGGTVGGTAVFKEFGYVKLTGTATFDPGSLNENAKTAIQTMTVTGATLGDFVQASFSNDLAGVVLTAWVSTANTVSYFFKNENGADPIDLASGTVTVRVIKP